MTQNDDGTWVHPRTDEVLREAGLLRIEDYIKKRRNNLARHVTNNDTLERCRVSCRDFKNPKKLAWWELLGNQPIT